MKEDKKIEIAKKRFALAESYDAENRLARVNDIKFVRLGEQWPESVSRDRKRPGAERPILTINRLLQFRNQIVNEIRQNCPSIKIKLGDDQASDEIADIFDGKIRQSQTDSNAQTAYETAAENQIDTGLGYFRIITDYCDPKSFDQDIKFKRILDTNTVYYDVNSTEPDGSDSMWAFVVEEMSIDEFKAKYPNAEPTSWDGDDSWVKEDTVRVADYYYIDSKELTLCIMQDGSVVYKDELPEEYHTLIVNERKTEDRICKICKIGGDSILEESEIPCSYIPVIPVIGSEAFSDGKRVLFGLTRPAMDSQRLYNYMESANVEALALSPKATYVGAAGQFDGFEAQWATSNRLNHAYLTYNPISDMGTVLPPPRREQPPSVNPGYESSMNRAAEDIKATMGIYDASLGNKEADQSGKAINAQMRQASTGNYHFSANLARSIEHAGRICLEILSNILDTPRSISIMSEDGTQRVVKIDNTLPEAVNEINGEKVYNLQKGKYKVVSDAGPNYATRRQEAVDAQMQMAQADPTLLQIAGDIIVGNMPWPGAEEIAKRKKAMLPPQIQALIKEEAEEGQPQIDPQIEQQMNQMADQVEHLSQELQEMHAKSESKEEELEIKRFEAQTKRLEVQHKIALESTDLTHRMALEQMTAEQAMQPNTGETEDPEDDENNLPIEGMLS